MNVEQRFSELDMLTALATHVASPQDLGQPLASFCADLFSADICSVWVVTREEGQPDRLQLIGYRGFRGEMPSWEEPPSYELHWDAECDKDINGVTAWVAVRRKPYAANSYTDLHEHPSHRGQWDEKVFAGHADARFLCLRAAPLIAGDKVVGVLKIENAVDSKRRWSHADFSVLLDRVAPAASILVDAAIEHNKSDLGRQKALNDIAEQFLQPILDPGSLYQTIVDTAADVLQAEICSLWIVDQLRRSLYLGAAHGVKGSDPPSGSQASEAPTYEVNWNEKDDTRIEGVTAWVAVRGRPYTANSYAELEKHPAHRGKWDRTQFDGQAPGLFRCLHAEPLICSGRTIGVFKVENRKRLPTFTEGDKSTCRLLAQFLALALEQTGRLAELSFDYFHLLKEPIANVLQVYQMLERDLRQIQPVPERLADWLEVFRLNLTNLSAWTTIAYALGRSTREQGDRKTVSIADIYREAARRLEFAAQHKLFQETGDIDNYVLDVTDNEEKMTLVVFFNIMHNSLKSVAEMGDRGRVELRISDDADGRLRVTISDNGIGIDPDELRHVFEPGFSKQHPKFPDALGLGLTTVARLLADLGWERELGSKPGVGTSFSVVIPKATWRKAE